MCWSLKADSEGGIVNPVMEKWSPGGCSLVGSCAVLAAEF